MVVELIVPRDLLPDVERMEATPLQAKPVDDPALRFGIVEMLAVLLAIERIEDVVKKALDIRQRLARPEHRGEKAILRSPVRSSSVEISGDDSEDDVRSRIEDEFSES